MEVKKIEEKETGEELPLSEWWKAWRERRDKKAQERLVEKYLPLVEYVANRLSVGLSSSVKKEDLISYGRIGLLDAVNKFEYERGLQFETYAIWRIRGAMIDGLRQEDWLSRSLREKTKKIEEAYSALEQKLLRSVTDEELCEHLGLSLRELHKLLSDTAFANMLSMDDPVLDEEGESSRHFLVADRKEKEPESILDREQTKVILAETIERLPEKERLVVNLFYYEELTLTEIARIMNLSPSRISQLHSKALYRMRTALKRQQSLVIS